MQSVSIDKVGVVADLPGAAGVVSHASHSAGTGRFFEDSKRWLTAEVNAAVDGLLTAGVGEVLVIDAHEPGAIHFESLHPEARLLHGRPLLLRQMFDPLWECDAVALVGQHARAGTRDGNQNQTLSGGKIDSMKLNDRPIGESTLVALWAGVGGVPTIYLSGDEAACREIQKEIPRITTAAVKRGVSAGAEITLSAHASRALINRTIQDAVHAQRRSPLPPLRWPGPFHLEIRWKSTQDADIAEHQSGGERIDDQTVRYCSGDLREVLNQQHRPPANAAREVHRSPARATHSNGAGIPA